MVSSAQIATLHTMAGRLYLDHTHPVGCIVPFLFLVDEAPHLQVLVDQHVDVVGDIKIGSQALHTTVDGNISYRMRNRMLILKDGKKVNEVSCPPDAKPAPTDIIESIV